MGTEIKKPCGPEYPRKKIPFDRDEGEMHARIKKEKEDAEQLQEEEP